MGHCLLLIDLYTVKHLPIALQFAINIKSPSIHTHTIEGEKDEERKKQKIIDVRQCCNKKNCSRCLLLLFYTFLIQIINPQCFPAWSYWHKPAWLPLSGRWRASRYGAAHVVTNGQMASLAGRPSGRPDPQTSCRAIVHL